MFAIPIYTSFGFPFQIMDVSKFKDGRVHWKLSDERVEYYSYTFLYIVRAPH